MNLKIPAKAKIRILTLAAVLMAYPAYSSASAQYQAGDFVEFTSFPQDSNADKSVSTPLQWQILEIDQENHKMLLLSRYGIKASSYCTPAAGSDYSESCSYEGSNAASALNGLEDGDSLVNFLPDGDGDESGVIPFMDSTFFLLNAAEVEKYLKNPGERILYPVPDMTKSKTAADLTEQGYGWWWLRSDKAGDHAPFVDFSGKIQNEGTYVFHGGGLLRPAVWIDTEKFKGKVIKKPYTVKFGEYRQKDTAAQAEPIEWIVVSEDAKGNRLLVSRYGLDYIQFFSGSGEEEYNAWKWSSSAMRQFLNGQFFNTAFSSKERKFIIESQLRSNEFIFGSDPEGMSSDRVFLLSEKEVAKYLIDYNYRNAEATPFAVSKIRKDHPDYNSEAINAQAKSWVLRERSNAMECYDGCTQMRIVENGHLSENGPNAENSFVVRPAMWVSPGFNK
jgi:hypothetical protein